METWIMACLKVRQYGTRASSANAIKNLWLNTYQSEQKWLKKVASK